MAEYSKIEWTDATWNPITGCSVVSPGCTNCYAMKLAGTRLRHHPSRQGLTVETKAGPVWSGMVRFNDEWLLQPLRWTRPRHIFVCAHGDLFHEAVPDMWIVRVMGVMARAKQHTFQVLTKRAARMQQIMRFAAIQEAVKSLGDGEWPPSNIWFGVSAEDGQRAGERVPILLDTPARVRFLSCEPLLGPADLTNVGGKNALDKGVDWVIVGGESGPRARPMDPAWARSLLEQCRDHRVPFFMKQMSGKGDIPNDLLVRQFPSGPLPKDLADIVESFDEV